jgi:hypothetical protein
METGEMIVSLASSPWALAWVNQRLVSLRAPIFLFSQAAAIFIRLNRNR